jgi:DNA primase
MRGVCDLRANAVHLKAEISIVCIIGETLVLKPNGCLHVALCPFRGDRTPSFTVYLDHFHCFGCGVHRDVLDWLMHGHRMTFPEAVQHLSRGTQYKQQLW